MTLPRACGAALPLAILAATLPAQSDLTCECPGFGFQIDRPGTDWIVAQQKLTVKSAFKLTIYHRTTKTVQIQVHAVPAGATTAKATVQTALRYVAAKPGYSKIAEVKKQLAGTKAPGVSVVLKDHRLQQFYVVAHGLRYSVLCQAPLASFASHREDFDKALASFRIHAANKKVQRDRQRNALALKCGSEIPWATDWAQAAARAKNDNRLILVVVSEYSAFAMRDGYSASALMDPDIIELVRHRFVGLRFNKKMSAPFRSQKAYGLGASTFGQGLLLVTPAGKVVHQTLAYYPPSVYAFLREGLQRAPQTNGKPELAKNPLALAEQHLRRGELEQARPLLENPTTLRGHLLRATLYRRLRDGKQALTALHAARAKSSKDQQAEILLRQAVVHLRMGNTLAARSRLDEILQDHEASDSVPEALYWKAVCDCRSLQAKAAVRHFEELADKHSASRWAWRAAAYLTNPLAKFGRGFRTEWPTEDFIRATRPRAKEPKDLARLQEVQTDAISFLLRRQRRNGSWLSTDARMVETTVGAVHPFVTAYTALCSKSLLPHCKQDAKCQAAVERGLKFLLDAHERTRKAKQTRRFMDYTVWSHAFVLWFLADCLDSKLGDAKVLRQTMGQIIVDLATRQQDNGGWSYHVTTDLSAEGKIDYQSISFMTASVILALQRAQAKVDVPTKLRDSAVDCLAKMRNEDGTFSYMLHVHGAAKRRVTHEAGAAGRAPVCELALYRAGRSSLPRLAAAVDMFHKHRDTYARQLGKVLMHAGAHGQGCHYLMFDYAMTALAVRELPAKQRPTQRRWLLELLLDARCKGGGFEDTPLTGWDYGTAMALIAFHAL